MTAHAHEVIRAIEIIVSYVVTAGVTGTLVYFSLKGPATHEHGLGCEECRGQMARSRELGRLIERQAFAMRPVENQNILELQKKLEIYQHVLDSLHVEIKP